MVRCIALETVKKKIFVKKKKNGNRIYWFWKKNTIDSSNRAMLKFWFSCSYFSLFRHQKGKENWLALEYHETYNAMNRKEKQLLKYVHPCSLVTF